MVNVKNKEIQSKIVKGICMDLKYKFEQVGDIFNLYRNQRDKIHGNIMFQGKFKEVVIFLSGHYKDLN